VIRTAVDGVGCGAVPWSRNAEFRGSFAENLNLRTLPALIKLDPHALHCTQLFIDRLAGRWVGGGAIPSQGTCATTRVGEPPCCYRRASCQPAAPGPAVLPAHRGTRTGTPLTPTLTLTSITPTQRREGQACAPNECRPVRMCACHGFEQGGGRTHRGVALQSLNGCRVQSSFPPGRGLSLGP
jgi:hypothetical protein